MPQVTITDTSAELLHELWEGMRAEHGDTRTEAELVDNAIMRVHRGFVGRPPRSEGGPDQPTGPFRKWASDRPAEVLVRQVDATTFRLAQPFRYDDGSMRFDVPEDDVTDLASVPPILTWLVPRYGRHTLAALAHDHLQDVPEVSPQRADVIFRDSMGQIGVPLARRWLMWAAVALRTQWKMGGLRKARAFLWAAFFAIEALALSLCVVIVFPLAFGWDALLLGVIAIGASVLLPVVLCPVWGKRLAGLGALTGIALVFLTTPVALVSASLGLYLGVEWVAEHLLVARPNRNPVLTRHL